MRDVFCYQSPTSGRADHAPVPPNQYGGLGGSRRHRPLAAAVVLDVSRRLLRGARLHCFPRRVSFLLSSPPSQPFPLCAPPLPPRRRPFPRILSRCPFLSGRGGGGHNDEAVWPRACANDGGRRTFPPRPLPLLRLRQQSPPRCVHSSPRRRRRWRWPVTLRATHPDGACAGRRVSPFPPTHPSVPCAQRSAGAHLCIPPQRNYRSARGLGRAAAAGAGVVAAGRGPRRSTRRRSRRPNPFAAARALRETMPAPARRPHPSVVPAYPTPSCQIASPPVRTASLGPPFLPPRTSSPLVCPWPLRAASGACDYAFESQVPEVARGRHWAPIHRENGGARSDHAAAGRRPTRLERATDRLRRDGGPRARQQGTMAAADLRTPASRRTTAAAPNVRGEETAAPSRELCPSLLPAYRSWSGGFRETMTRRR